MFCAQPIQLARLLVFCSSFTLSLWSWTSLKGRGLLPANVAPFSGLGGELDGGGEISPDWSLAVLEVSLVLPPGNVAMVGTWPPLGYLAPALGFPPTAGGVKKDCEVRGVWGLCRGGETWAVGPLYI